MKTLKIMEIFTFVMSLILFGWANIGFASTRDIPDDNLGYPVHIKLHNSGEASGFYVRTTSHTYLVTARHVFFAIPTTTTVLPAVLPLRTTGANLISFPTDTNERGTCEYAVDLQVLAKNGRILASD